VSASDLDLAGHERLAVARARAHRDVGIIRAQRRHPDITGPELARRFGISKALVWRILGPQRDARYRARQKKRRAA